MTLRTVSIGLSATVLLGLTTVLLLGGVFLRETIGLLSVIGGAGIYISRRPVAGNEKLTEM